MRLTPLSHHVSPSSILAAGVCAVRLRALLSVLLCLLLTAASVADAFSVRWDQPESSPMLSEDGTELQEFGEYGDEAAYREPSYNGSDVENQEEEEPNHVDQYINVLKRWGHQSRFPWKRLRKGMCFRQPCRRDKECCQRFSICDRSAHVCVDCWYGSRCKSERDCCMNYPYCQRVWKKTHSGKRYIESGKCVAKL